MRFYLSLITLLITITLSGCSHIPVNQDYDDTADFNAIKSMQWLPAAQQSKPSAVEFEQQQPLIAKRIRNAIANSLAAKNIALSTQSADAYITYHVSVQTKLRTEPFTTTIGFGSFGYHGGFLFQTTPDLVEYEEGKLVIDVLNRQGQVIWRGISTTHLTEQSTPQKTTELVDAVVNKVLSQYPPK